MSDGWTRSEESRKAFLEWLQARTQEDAKLMQDFLDVLPRNHQREIDWDFLSEKLSGWAKSKCLHEWEFSREKSDFE